MRRTPRVVCVVLVCVALDNRILCTIKTREFYKHTQRFLPTLLVRALGPLATDISVVCAILEYVPWFVSLISDVIGSMLLQRCFVLVALWLVSTGVRFFKVGRFSVGGRHTPDSQRVPRFRDKACSPVAAA